MPKKRTSQLSLFDPPDSGKMSLDEFRTLVRSKTKPSQPEKAFMNDLIKTAFSLDLPCIHIQYFCGNKFYPECSGTKKYPHNPTQAICPVCSKPVLAHCLNRVNKGLAGHYDILGINWAIETKHKRNKGKEKVKPSQNQINHSFMYQTSNIPHIVVNEDSSNDAFSFLKNLSKKNGHSKDLSISLLNIYNQLYPGSKYLSPDLILYKMSSEITSLRKKINALENINS